MSLKIVVFPAPGGETIIVLYIVLFSISIIYLKTLLLHPFICLAILKFKLDILFIFIILLFSIIAFPDIPNSMSSSYRYKSIAYLVLI